MAHKHLEPGHSTATKHVVPGQRVTVKVPGTSANLGPGFDSLGLAVTLYDSLTVTSLEDGGALEFDLSGEGVDDIPRDERHLVVMAMDVAFERLGYVRGGLLIAAQNVLPHGRGLGSSASAIVAAILAANSLVAAADQQDLGWVLQLSSEMEGHPDNVAPAIFGAGAISWSEGGAYASAKVTPSSSVIPVVAIPDYEVKTELARSLLPSEVPHTDAAANSGRTALLIHALKDAPELLLAGTRDYLHQDYRTAAMEPSAKLVAALRAAGYAAFISGAGPTVMTLATSPEQAEAVEAIIASMGNSATPTEESRVSWRVMALAVDVDGAKVEVHPGS